MKKLKLNCNKHPRPYWYDSGKVKFGFWCKMCITKHVRLRNFRSINFFAALVVCWWDNLPSMVLQRTENDLSKNNCLRGVIVILLVRESIFVVWVKHEQRENLFLPLTNFCRYYNVRSKQHTTPSWCRT